MDDASRIEVRRALSAVVYSICGSFLLALPHEKAEARDPVRAGNLMKNSLEMAAFAI
ncbi:MAG: hypothetical protein HPY75_10400 [Actinobacteria bacterium]|nr:hypothetical protein [Actinomycetota bacterium]